MRLGSDRCHWIRCVSVGRMRVIDRQWICKQDKRTEEEVEARYKRGEASAIAKNEDNVSFNSNYLVFVVTNIF